MKSRIEVFCWISGHRRRLGDKTMKTVLNRVHFETYSFLMTDTDNSHQAATAWYGDIYFSAE